MGFRLGSRASGRPQPSRAKDPQFQLEMVAAGLQHTSAHPRARARPRQGKDYDG